MSDVRTPDAYVIDRLDVEAEIKALDIALRDLDQELDVAEQESTELLADLWRPDPGMEDRVVERVRDRLQAREEAWLVFDLVNLGWQTMKTVFDLETEGDSDDQ